MICSFSFHRAIIISRKEEENSCRLAVSKRKRRFSMSIINWVAGNVSCVLIVHVLSCLTLFLIASLTTTGKWLTSVVSIWRKTEIIKEYWRYVCRCLYSLIGGGEKDDRWKWNVRLRWSSTSLGIIAHTESEKRVLLLGFSLSSSLVWSVQLRNLELMERHHVKCVCSTVRRHKVARASLTEKGNAMSNPLRSN